MCSCTGCAVCDSLHEPYKAAKRCCLQTRGSWDECCRLHGDLGKLGRSTILKKFKSGQERVLITNELAARGPDVPECDLVVNLDLPTDSIHYAHQAGRTGRLGRKGTVVTICEEPGMFVVKKLQKQLESIFLHASLQRASLLSLKKGRNMRRP
jgi:superfamily II DNA/RNA helicase